MVDDALSVLIGLFCAYYLLVTVRAVSRVSSSISFELRSYRPRGVETDGDDEPPSGQLQPRPGGLPYVPPREVLSARGAWSRVDWSDLRLRIGPNYKRNKRKGPTLSPLLECVGVDIFQSPRKVFSDGEVDAACLPEEVALAAGCRPAAPPDASPSTLLLTGPSAGGSPSAASQPLPKYLVVSICMPKYPGPEADGPCYKYCWYLAVPPTLRSEPAGGAAAMLCEFLDGAADGHTMSGSKYFDRFKVIVRLRILDRNVGFFLRQMVSQFNGKPMLWRFWGVWGCCLRKGDVVFANLDFMTGGRLKNSAFSQACGGSGLDSVVFDVSWTLESRCDAEMPERLLGGGTICRPDLSSARHLYFDSTGKLRVGEPGEAGERRALSGLTHAVPTGTPGTRDVPRHESVSAKESYPAAAATATAAAAAGGGAALALPAPKESATSKLVRYAALLVWLLAIGLGAAATVVRPSGFGTSPEAPPTCTHAKCRSRHSRAMPLPPMPPAPPVAASPLPPPDAPHTAPAGLSIRLGAREVLRPDVEIDRHGSPPRLTLRNSRARQVHGAADGAADGGAYPPPADWTAVQMGVVCLSVGSFVLLNLRPLARFLTS